MDDQLSANWTESFEEFLSGYEVTDCDFLYSMPLMIPYCLN
jgi:hypothetical protein